MMKKIQIQIHFKFNGPKLMLHLFEKILGSDNNFFNILVAYEHKVRELEKEVCDFIPFIFSTDLASCHKTVRKSDITQRVEHVTSSKNVCTGG